MPEDSSSGIACLVATTSGRILLLWDQDATLPFQFPQLAMLLASLFHFSQAQSFCHLELQNGFTLLISSDVDTQVSVAVICITPPSKRDRLEYSTAVEPLQLGRLKSLLILHELVRCYRDDIERLAKESLEQSNLMAEQYTLTNALNGFEDNYGGTLDEFVAFQNVFVSRVMEITARDILNSTLSWSQTWAKTPSTVRLARGFLVNAETGETVYSTRPDPSFGFFGSCHKLDSLHSSARVEQILKRVATLLPDTIPILNNITGGNNIADAAIVVKFKSVSGGKPNELFVALRMLPIGTFASGVVFFGVNTSFQGQDDKLCLSEKFHQTLATHTSGKRISSALQDPSVDFELHVGSNGAPEVIWEAMGLLVRPLMQTRYATVGVASVCNGPTMPTFAKPIVADPALHSKQNVTPRLPEYTEEVAKRRNNKP